MKKKFLGIIITASMLLTSCSNVAETSVSVSESSNNITTETKTETQIETEPLKDRIDRYENLYTGNYSSDEYSFDAEGDWELIGEKSIAVTNLFYQVYPRLSQRWGDENTPQKIKITASSDTDEIAYVCDDELTFSTTYLNEHPYDIGFFAHELMHAVQHYENFEGGWWTEGLASYAGFRYFHMANKDSLTIVDYKNADGINWEYDPYGNCIMFFAYMDSKYPTVNGQKGLIDSINQGIKSGEINSAEEPCNPDTAFNQVVKNVTGFNTIDELRIQYVKEITEGTWTFSGFGDYQDNNLISDSTIEYPEITSNHGQTKGEKITGIEYGKNILEGATVIRSSGFINESEKDTFSVDGDQSTKWCAQMDNVKDVCYLSEGVEHYILLDIGKVEEFNSYTIVSAGDKEDEYYNTKTWELLGSEDGVNFFSIDYQENNTDSTASFSVESTKARYFLLKIYNAEQNGSTVRIYELEAGMVS